MRMIREVLRLHYQSGLSTRQIGRALQLPKSSVSDYLRRATAAELDWPLPQSIDDDELEGRLFPKPPHQSTSRDRFGAINFHYLAGELKKKNVTFTLLWAEYKRANPNGYQYTQFRKLYKDWKKSVDLPMRQDHKAGEKLFIDYCGQTLPYRDSDGREQQAAVFVAVLGASNLTFACATASQGAEDWLDAHVKAFRFFGGVAEILVPDNLKSGVTKACPIEPTLNASYQELARHYGTVVMPARVRKPKDKSKAELGVQLVQRWICAALRGQAYFGLDHLNGAIAQLLDQLNRKPFKKLPGNRLERFEALERAQLLPLPDQDYTYAQWHRTRVGHDYHVPVGRHYYSVPHAYASRMVDIRVSRSSVEVCCKNERVAVHPRIDEEGNSTIVAHMPPNHRFMAGWNERELRHWASETGEATAALFHAVLTDETRHHHQRKRTCIGTMNLARGFGRERLEAACRRAVEGRAFSYRSVRSILEKRLDQQVERPATDDEHGLDHDNIRGPIYYG